MFEDGTNEWIWNNSNGEYQHFSQIIKHSQKIVEIRWDYSKLSNEIQFKNFMITDGETDQDYVEHEEQNFIMPLKQSMHEGDYLAEDGIHHVRKTMELTGDENWITHVQASNEYKLSNIINGYSGNSKIINNLYCTHFKSTIQDNVFEGLLGIAMLGGSVNSIYISMGSQNKEVTSLTQFIEWLKAQYNAGTPVIIEYELATEEIEPYTSEQQKVYDEIQKAKTYYETTHIYSTDEVKPKMQLTYKKSNIIARNNMQKQIDDLSKIVLNLSGEGA